ARAPGGGLPGRAAAAARGRGVRGRPARGQPAQRAGRGARAVPGAEGDRMSALHDLSVAALAGRLKAGEVSAVEVAQHFLSRGEAHAGLGAFLAMDPEVTLAQARAADARIAAGEAAPLLGVPVAHKDIFV